eukprot:6679764-Lingulodinium_polyedra.AAC.1
MEQFVVTCKHSSTKDRCRREITLMRHAIRPPAAEYRKHAIQHAPPLRLEPKWQRRDIPASVGSTTSRTLLRA